MKKANLRVKALACLVVLITIAATVFFNISSNSHAQKIKVFSDPGEAHAHVPGRILVKFHDRILPAHARNIIAALGARDADEVPNIGVHILDLPYQANERAFVQRFQEQPEVEFAELDQIVAPADVTPNDPLYPTSESWGLRKIQAPSAWITNTGSSDVVIAIVDTGVDGTHEDLATKMVSGWNVYDNNSNTSDVFGHGTKVAGTAAASSNNFIGVAGVAWGCKIMPVRISNTNGSATYSAMASGITWAANHGAKVANLSYVATSSSTVRSAAQFMQSKGGVTVVAAGNSSVFDSASDNPYVLTVSATDETDSLSYFSNTGNNIDLAAPEAAYSTRMNGGYTFAGGTSISSPAVAGVAALVLSVNPNLSPAEVQDILKRSADDLGPAGWDPSFGSGRVNAARAVAMAGGTPAPTPSPTPVPSPSPSPTPPTPTPTPLPSPDTTSPTVTITAPVNGAKVAVNTSVYVNAADNLSVTRVELYVDGKLTATSTSAPFTTKWNTKKVTAGPHTLHAKAYDAAGNAGSSPQVTVYK